MDTSSADICPARAMIITIDSDNPEINSADVAEYTNYVLCRSRVSIYVTLALVSCSHCFCLLYMTKCVTVTLFQMVGPPRCPINTCATVLMPSSFKGILPSNILKIIEDRVREYAISVGDMLYCPYSTCSALMSKLGLIRQAKHEGRYPKSRALSCVRCGRSLCLDCKEACPAANVHFCGDDEKR